MYDTCETNCGDLFMYTLTCKDNTMKVIEIVAFEWLKKLRLCIGILVLRIRPPWSAVYLGHQLNL